MLESNTHRYFRYFPNIFTEYIYFPAQYEIQKELSMIHYGDFLKLKESTDIYVVINIYSQQYELINRSGNILIIKSYENLQNQFDTKWKSLK